MWYATRRIPHRSYLREGTRVPSHSRWQAATEPVCHMPDGVCTVLDS
jgi:hypothetical protein